MANATFTSMDVSTRDEWLAIGAETTKNQPRVAERAGADDEVVVAALCHDIGKAISVPNHPAIAAAILKPYVRPEVHFMIEVHQDFQGKHYYEHFGLDPNARSKYEAQPAYDLAAKFADEWDQKAFDPSYDTLPLEHFEARVRAVFAKPKSLVGS